MFRILFLLVLGVGVGYALRRVAAVRRVDRTVRLTVCFLLFLFGVALGENRELLGQIGRVGGEAAAVALAGAAGSFGAACLLRRMERRKGGRP